MRLLLTVVMPVILVVAVSATTAPARSLQEGDSRQTAANSAVISSVDGNRLLASHPTENKPRREALTYERAVRSACWYAVNQEMAPYKKKGAKAQPTPKPRPVVIVRNPKPFRVQGLAETSWYGPGFHGRATASGIVFSRNDPTMAAHKTLPLGTVLRLTNESTKSSLEVTIVDRGPFVGKRELDISEAAAERLGIKDAGTAWLGVEVLSVPTS